MLCLNVIGQQGPAWGTSILVLPLAPLPTRVDAPTDMSTSLQTAARRHPQAHGHKYHTAVGLGKRASQGPGVSLGRYTEYYGLGDLDSKHLFLPLLSKIKV